MLGTSCSLDGGGGKASEAGNSVRPLSGAGFASSFFGFGFIRALFLHNACAFV